MARFQGEMQNSRGNTISTIGHHRLHVMARGWRGRIDIDLYRDGDGDTFRITISPHGGGSAIELASGTLDFEVQKGA